MNVDLRVAGPKSGDFGLRGGGELMHSDRTCVHHYERGWGGKSPPSATLVAEVADTCTRVRCKCSGMTPLRHRRLRTPGGCGGWG
jgi:hypothetical protein